MPKANPVKEDTDNSNAGSGQPENTEATEPKAPTVDDIGTLTYARAVTHFGKDNALVAMREVARIGGHGDFADEDLKSPLFGGLQMPDPAKLHEPVKADFEKMLDGEFYYRAAVEEFYALKKKAAENRRSIDELYATLKK